MTELLEKLSNDISNKIKDDFSFEVKINNEFKSYINHICNEKEDLIKNHLQNIYSQASVYRKKIKR